jgi:hypothetical protein
MQIKWSLIGFALSLVMLGAVLIIFFSIASTEAITKDKQ